MLHVKDVFTTAASVCVNGLDLHPKVPWMVCALSSGQATIWNYKTQELVRRFDVAVTPVLCVRFIPRIGAIACGTDDNSGVVIVNYTTSEEFKIVAHRDSVRHLAVDEEHQQLLTCSDDQSIKLWNWGGGWRHVQTFRGHEGFVAGIAFHSRDRAIFASASDDFTVKVWTTASTHPTCTLSGHEARVNCVEYTELGGKVCLLSGSDDCTVRLWDDLTKILLRCMSLKSMKVTACRHAFATPFLFITGVGGAITIWSTQSWCEELVLHYGCDYGWAVAVKCSGSEALVAVGFSTSAAVIAVETGEPPAREDVEGHDVGNERAPLLVLVDAEGPSISATDDDECDETYPVAAADAVVISSSTGQYIGVITDTDHIEVSTINDDTSVMDPATQTPFGYTCLTRCRYCVYLCVCFLVGWYLGSFLRFVMPKS
jgi:coatomer subunit beta'